MKTEGIVKEINGSTIAVSVIRQGACGGDCAACGGCGGKAVMTSAENKVGAEVGDRVLLESKSSAVLAAAFLTYILPILLLFAVYALCSALHFGKTALVLTEAAAAAVYVLLMKIGVVTVKIGVFATKIIERNKRL